MPLKLGELLLRNKLITKDQLDKALDLQRTNNSKLGYNLVKMGFVSDEEIATCLSKQLEFAPSIYRILKLIKPFLILYRLKFAVSTI